MRIIIKIANVVSSHKTIVRRGKYVRSPADVYSFYYKVDDDNSFKRGNVDADITTIHEVDNCTPHIEEHTIYQITEMGYLVGAKVKAEKAKVYDIYVPKGTIKRTLNLDSQ